MVLYGHVTHVEKIVTDFAVLSVIIRILNHIWPNRSQLLSRIDLLNRCTRTANRVRFYWYVHQTLRETREKKYLNKKKNSLRKIIIRKMHQKDIRIGMDARIRTGR